jgi:hypothetical protein
MILLPAFLRKGGQRELTSTVVNQGQGRAASGRIARAAR